MGVTAENLADKYGISREECDEYAFVSQQRWGKGMSYHYSTWYPPIYDYYLVFFYFSSSFALIYEL